jgi:hypothetical protein
MVAKAKRRWKREAVRGRGNNLEQPQTGLKAWRLSGIGRQGVSNLTFIVNTRPSLARTTLNDAMLSGLPTNGRPPCIPAVARDLPGRQNKNSKQDAA